MDIHEEKIIREEKKPKDDRRWREAHRCWLPYVGGLLLFLAGIGFSQLFMLIGSGLSEPQNIVVAFKNPVCTAPTVINCPKQHPQMRPVRENAEVTPPRPTCENRRMDNMMPRQTGCKCSETMPAKTGSAGCSCPAVKKAMSPRPECRCQASAPVTNKSCCGPQASVWPEQPQGTENPLHLKKHGRTA